MKTYNFAKTAETTTYFYDSINDRFCDNEKQYKTAPIKLFGEWSQTVGQADKKIIVDSELFAADIDKLINKAIAA